MASGLRLAVGTLTVVPVGPVAEPTRRQARWAMTLAPFAALPVAVVAGVVAALGELAGLPALVTAALVVGALALSTRAMHLDGLADTVDGLGAGWTRERALEVMRRGDVGPMGVAAVVVTLLVQVAGLAALVTRPWAWLVVGVVVAASRGALLLACRSGMPSARPSGLGAVVAGSVPTWAASLGGVAIAATLASATTAAGLEPWAGLTATVVATIVVAQVLRTCRRAFGGVSGDVMGASIELALTAILVALSSGRW
ncbi:cobalamin-5'-phosphate synthase [Knoellia remsis]|uniref:Adenosylcobinamide-GDP ribazoletransferase n=1 Tax=Knoellia remsis TaxID=407159 RepID=A0A2T0UZL2_9MICO|nr:adenosylcobinamide-GDP ribazoletransferase [Knoellia remsis]PRY63373.1 cobalamin-5'-phosphate synthase [Knoellia remsis]